MIFQKCNHCLKIFNFAGAAGTAQFLATVRFAIFLGFAFKS